jgi:acyl-ACP thioesterase
MNVVARKSIQIGDVSINRTLRLDALVNILQEVAILHTQQVGIGLNSLLDSGKTWVLNKIAVEINRLPRLDEEVEVHTWSRSIQRFKGLRDYRFYIDGEQVASASTLWLYLDIARRRPVRVPENYESLYGINATSATEVDIEAWQAVGNISADTSLTITTRISDFDVNGHVNNAIIMQYIQTAVTRVVGATYGIRNIQLAFMKEIPGDVTEVRAVVQKEGDRCLFQILKDETLFVSGITEISKIK